jgi:hypothetical protein
MQNSSPSTDSAETAKSKINPKVRAKLAEIGIDEVRTKLTLMVSVDEETWDLGDSLIATRSTMQAW